MKKAVYLIPKQPFTHLVLATLYGHLQEYGSSLFQNKEIFSEIYFIGLRELDREKQ